MKIRSIRELLDFHTRFDTGESYYTQYARTIKDKYTHSGKTREFRISLSETQKKLMSQALEQNILHKNLGYIHSLQLNTSVFYYVRSISNDRW